MESFSLLQLPMCKEGTKQHDSSKRLWNCKLLEITDMRQSAVCVTKFSQ